MSDVTQLNTTVQNAQNVQEVSKQKRPKSAGRLPKTHADYWEQRLYKNSYTRDGKSEEVTGWAVKIQYLGIRKTFTFETPNRRLASAKARDLYLDIVAKGWNTSLAHHKPEMAVRKDDPTVGEFLAEVGAKSGLGARTLQYYCCCLRKIVAGIAAIKAGPEKFDHRTGGNQAWRQTIEAIRLSSISPEKVQAWKVQYLREAGSSPSALQSARRTVNTYIRCGRALFTSRTLKFVTVRLPSPHPFEGITLEKSGSMRYQSHIDAKSLVAAARNELKSQHPESYKAFLLGLFCGLRRAEMDGLEWTAFDWERNLIRLSNTAVLRLKSDDSQAEVEADRELLNELRALQAANTSAFVLSSKLHPRPGSHGQYYRCQRVFEHLIGWLRAKGIKSNKPLHDLRKEFGSLINQKHGLYAAAQALRHSDITTSARHYIARKERVTVGLGALLEAPGVQPPSVDRLESTAADGPKTNTTR